MGVGKYKALSHKRKSCKSGPYGVTGGDGQNRAITTRRSKFLDPRAFAGTASVLRLINVHHLSDTPQRHCLASPKQGQCVHAHNLAGAGDFQIHAPQATR